MWRMQVGAVHQSPRGTGSRARQLPRIAEDKRNRVPEALTNSPRASEQLDSVGSNGYCWGCPSDRARNPTRARRQTRREGRTEMRLIKMLGLTAIAAVAAMAFVGVSSAMAESTAFCAEDSAESTCPPGKTISHVHMIDPALVMLNPIQNLTCEVLYLGEIEGSLGSPLVARGKLTITKCAAGCEIKEVSSEGEGNILKTGTELAEITMEGEVLAKCALVLHCVYNAANLVGHVLGGLTTKAGERGHLTFSEAPVEKVSGLLCPNVTSMDALFETLGKFYIRS